MTLYAKHFAGSSGLCALLNRKASVFIIPSKPKRSIWRDEEDASA
jgi:hypothetical protein